MDLISLGISLVVLIYSSVLHEIAHGFMAYRLGDPTAKVKGRLTLNPVSHIDPFFSLLMPAMTFMMSAGSFIFGGAKPVPVDTYNLRDGRRDLAMVSLVGPLTNILLAVFAASIAHLLYPGYTFNEVLRNDLIGMILAHMVQWNILLAVFNLIPIPPLDGSKVFSLLLPPGAAARFLALESIGFFLLILFIISPFMSIVHALRIFALSLLGF